MLAVPRTAKPLSWHGKQLAEMQHGASRAPMEARRDGGAQRLDAYASPRCPARPKMSISKSMVTMHEKGSARQKSLGAAGGRRWAAFDGLCLALYCPLRATYLRPGPACEKAAEQHAALSDNYGKGKPVREMQFLQ